MSSSLWDWVAALNGSGDAAGTFLPNYWWLPAKPGGLFGWVPRPDAILAVLVLVSLAGAFAYFARRRTGGLLLAAALWGALLADTPFVIVLPLLAGAAAFVASRVANRLDRDVKTLRRFPWGATAAVFVTAFLIALGLDLVRTRSVYVHGYVRQALTLLREGYHPVVEGEMDRLLNAYVDELAREGEGCRWMFTDGSCDAGVERAARGAFATIALSDGAHDASYWFARGITRHEDITALKSGPAALLRSWAVDRSESFTNVAFQTGFAFLEKEAPGRLVRRGLVLRGGACAAEERARADAAVRALGENIVRFYKEGGKPALGGGLRNRRFCTMQWRVARAIRRQALECDRAVKVAEADAASALAEELDGLNPFAWRQLGATESVDLRTFGAITPREGLAFALRRANFSLAKQFAVAIVKDEPNHPEANFALAMNHFALKEYALARHYFEIALASRPDDPALLNNAALAALALGDREDAEKKARAALRVKPDEEAIRDTLRKIEQSASAKR